MPAFLRSATCTSRMAFVSRCSARRRSSRASSSASRAAASASWRARARASSLAPSVAIWSCRKLACTACLAMREYVDARRSSRSRSCWSRIFLYSMPTFCPSRKRLWRCSAARRRLRSFCSTTERMLSASSMRRVSFSTRSADSSWRMRASVSRSAWSARSFCWALRRATSSICASRAMRCADSLSFISARFWRSTSFQRSRRPRSKSTNFCSSLFSRSALSRCRRTCSSRKSRCWRRSSLIFASRSSSLRWDSWMRYSLISA
mmetsp:Transcript_19468/g.57442  ORF Transcript_19468/g.57442 Transcript_19468/m.57442 type:complete len:263 (-) Transcript_19468:63-851(-)